MKFTKIEKIIIGALIVSLLICIYSSIKTANYLNSNDFKKDATEFRDWIKGN